MSLGGLYLCNVLCDVFAYGSLGVEGSIWVERGRRKVGGGGAGDSQGTCGGWGETLRGRVFLRDYW